MKIISLEAENVKRIKAVRIEPNGNMVEISGKNAQGKTSVLDSIYWAIAGKDAVQSTPIRKGEEAAIIKLDLGELKITRKFKATDDGDYTTTIAVESPEGAKYGSPQKMLDDLIGELSFDPLAFTRMKPGDQLETLKRFVPGVDFAAIEKANKADFDERTIVNRRAKELRAQADGMGIVGAIPEPIDETALVAELESAGAQAAEIERRKAGRAAAEQQEQAHTARILEMAGRRETAERQIAALQETVAAISDAISDAEAERAALSKKLRAAPPLPEPIDTSAIKARIAEARQRTAEITSLRDRAAAKEDANKRAKDAETKAKDLTKAIDDRNAAKEKAISEAALPVPGITFADGGVMLDGVPFDQASDAQQLRASIAIASAMNPKLRVIRVRDGSLLDADSWALLGEFADKNDMQVWAETVASGRPGAVVIEDGMVKS